MLIKLINLLVFVIIINNYLRRMLFLFIKIIIIFKKLKINKNKYF